MNTRRGFLRSLGVATLAVALDVLPRFGVTPEIKSLGAVPMNMKISEALRKSYSENLFRAAEGFYVPDASSMKALQALQIHANVWGR